MTRWLAALLVLCSSAALAQNPGVIFPDLDTKATLYTRLTTSASCEPCFTATPDANRCVVEGFFGQGG